MCHPNATVNGTTVKIGSKAAQNNWSPPPTVNIGSASSIFLKNIHDVLVSGTILVYGIWNMVCGIWYENWIHSIFAYVSHASHLGCLQHSASIPCNKLFTTTEANNPSKSLNTKVDKQVPRMTQAMLKCSKAKNKCFVKKFKSPT